MTANSSSGLSRPLPVIDVGSALDLLGAAVQRMGSDFVYQPVWTTTSGYLTCRYANGGAPDCIVGQALALAGVGFSELAAMPDDRIRDLYLREELPVALTLGALVVFDAAQRSQDRGCRWGDVFTSATAAAVRFIDLVPDAVFDRAQRQSAAAANVTVSTPRQRPFC